MRDETDLPRPDRDRPKMRPLLVTGLRGFVGSTLCQALRENAEGDGWSPCALPAGFDLLDAAAVRELVRRAAPEAIIHLAARTSVAASFRDPAATLRVNVLGTLNLLQAARDAGFRGRFLHVGTGDVYGAVSAERLPVDEEAPVVPRSPYAVSKLASEALCRQWSLTEELDVILARPFNHAGPGQAETYAVAGFARQVARIKLGLQAPEVAVGDLDVTRDFTDVRDVVRAYLMMLAQARPALPYNVCSGRETRLRDVLDRLLALAGVDAVVREDAGRMRAGEQRRACGSNARLARDTGWSPRATLDDTLAATLDDWMHRERDVR